MKKNIIYEAEEKLRTKEYKLTSRRELILQVFLENEDRHLSAEEIYYLVKIKAPDAGLATVYRTLDLFLDFEIIQSIDFGDGRKRYELILQNKESHYHHHLICTKCGRVQEVNEDLLEELESRVSHMYDFIVVNHQVKLFGYCKKCVKK